MSAAALLGVAEELVAVPSSDGEARAMSRTGNRFVVGMDEILYHSGPEISASGLKVVAKSPKAFQASRTVRVEKKTFDVGHAVHGIVLGTGLPVEEIPDELLSGEYRSVSSAAAKAKVAEIRAAGKVPLKGADYRKVVAQVEALLKNPKARRLLEVPGLSELSMFADDPETGLRVRGRIDRAHRDPETGEIVIVDVKTAEEIELHKIRAAVDRLGYDLSMEVYRFLVELITGEIAAPTVLIFTEKTFPYDVRTVRLGEAWIEGGWKKFRAAMTTYQEAVVTGVWPGVDEEDGDIPFLDAPAWYESRALAEEGVL